MGEREHAINYFLQKCSLKYQKDAIIHMRFNTQDRGNENVDDKNYSMCYNKNKPELEKYCGPDWTFYHWPSASIPSFEKVTKEIIEASSSNPKVEKVGWIGNIYSPLSDLVEFHTRPLLKNIGDSNPALLETFHVRGPNCLIDATLPHYLSLPDLVKKYKYLLDIGGNGYSGRLKFLLFSKRPLLIVERNYIEYFQNELIPYKHFIPVKMDLSDLLEKIHWIKNNEEKSNEIANNAFDYAVNNFTEDKLLERVIFVYNNINGIKMNNTIFNGFNTYNKDMGSNTI